MLVEDDDIGSMAGSATMALRTSSGSVLPSLDIVHDDTLSSISEFK